MAGLVVSLLAVSLSVTCVDADLWGHLRFGLDILDLGRVPQTDHYSYLTEGQRWINHEWLAEALFALSWRAAAATGLILFKTVVGLLTVGILVRHLLAYRLNGAQVAILLVLLGTPVLIPFVTARPQIFTALLFSLLLVAIQRAEQRDFRWLWSAPPLLAAWANLHGGFLAGLGILGLWTALHLIDFRERLQFVLPATLGAVATLLNPYDFDLLFFLLQTATGSRPEIEDWQPLPLASAQGILYLVVLATTITGLVFSRKPRRPVPLLLVGLTALLPWLAIRHLPLFSIAAIVFAGEHVASAWHELVSTRGRQASIEVSRWGPALPVLAAAAVLGLGLSESTFTRIRVPDPDKWPAAPVALLARSGIAGNLLTEYGWGEYAIWHLGPRIQVGMDGRRETIYPPLNYQLFRDFDAGLREWDLLLKQYRTDVIIVKPGETPYNLLKLSPTWSLLFEDKSSALFVNEASAVHDALRHAASDFQRPAPREEFP